MSYPDRERSGSLDISVVICTWNRSRLLRKTLARMTSLHIPAGLRWELIVVNNNCSDDTDAVLEEFRNRLPLVVLHEPTPGKSFAANLAVESAKGEYIVWTDDDVLVESNWLEAYLTAFRRWPDASIFAGAIDPWFEEKPPTWLEKAFREVANAYASLDFGPQGFAMTPDTYPYGANMALKRQAHLEERFDIRLGPLPNKKIGGEEMVLTRRLLAAGHTGRWLPEARVRHLIPPERYSIAYLRGYYVGSGRVLGMLGREDKGERRAFGRPLWLWKEFLREQTHYFVARIFEAPDKWVARLRNASVARGRLLTYVSKSVHQ